MKLPISKKTAALVTTVVVLGAVGGTVAQVTNQNKAGADTSPIVTEVDNHEDRLKNHEARISNLETDVRVVQTNTNTQPSSNKVVVPTVRDVTSSTPATSSTSVQADAVTVTAYKEIVLDADNSDCEYTYSDNSTYTFAWKRTNPQGARVYDGDMGSGRWIATTSYSGACDKSALGKVKSS